jgi:flagellar biosynthesis protein FlhB
MADQGFQERTEPATPRRRKQAREEGKVARSQEITSAFVLLFGMGTLAVAGPFIFTRMADLVRRLLSQSGQIEMNTGALMGYFKDGVPYVLSIIAPLAGAILIIGLVVNFAQVGFVLSFKPLTPKLDTISPIKGFGRLFSKRSGMELFKSITKIVLIGWIAYLTLKGEIPTLAGMMGSNPMPVFSYAASVALKLGLRIGLAILCLAIIDYAFQRWEMEKSIMMSHKEVEEETRQTEGDPHVKGRIRAQQREIARRRMMDDLKTADVVVTNPTRLAVAIKYDRSNMRSPKIVAKGARLVAKRIREAAREHGIPMVEDPPLARLLFKVEIDSDIPVTLFQTVAELLAHVYKLKAHRSRFVQAAMH